MPSTPRPPPLRRLRGPRRHQADGQIPDAPPAFPSIPMGAHLEASLGRRFERPPEVDASLESTTENALPPPIEPTVIGHEEPPRDLRAMAVGLGCLATVALGAGLIAGGAMLAMWSGLLGG